MGRYTVAVQSPSTLHGGIAVIKEYFLYSSSHWPLHVFFDHDCSIKRARCGCASSSATHKGQSFSLHKDVKVRDCPLDISQILETHFIVLELSFSFNPQGGAGLLFCSLREALESFPLSKRERPFPYTLMAFFIVKSKKKSLRLENNIRA